MRVIIRDREALANLIYYYTNTSKSPAGVLVSGHVLRDLGLNAIPNGLYALKDLGRLTWRGRIIDLLSN